MRSAAKPIEFTDAESEHDGPDPATRRSRPRVPKGTVYNEESDSNSSGKY